MNLLFHKQSLLLVRVDEKLILPTKEQLDQLNFSESLITVDKVHCLGFINDVDDVNEWLRNYPLFEFVSLRQILGLFSTALLETIIYAQQLIYYQETNRYCSSCGNPTKLVPISKWLYCENCNHEIYPRIAPAMIVAITKGDKLLMAQGNNFAADIWALLAGFCEVGESLEQTVQREVFEEVGIKIKNIKYFGSQYWPFPNSLMVGFIAEYESGEIKLDPVEMRAADFFSVNELPGRPSSRLSISSYLIDDFITKHS